MRLVETFLPEFEHEVAGTRRILELVPDHLLMWKAHESLNTIGWLASHLADTLSWMEVTISESSFDIAPVGGTPHSTPVLDSQAEILASFDTNLAAARASISPASDQQMQESWTLLQGGETVFCMPRIAVVKSLFVNHMIHHRAFLIAYLRINDIECPAMYG